MTQASQQQIKQQLDTLANRGRASLLALVNAKAQRSGLRALLCCLVPLGLLSIICQQFIAHKLVYAPLFWALCLLVSAVIFVTVFLRQRLSVNISRAQSLAVFDQHAATDDRLQTAAEFCHIAQPNGFQLAAIADCQQLLAQMLAAPAPKLAYTAQPFSRVLRLQPLLAVLLLAALWWQPLPDDTDALGDSGANVTAEPFINGTLTVSDNQKNSSMIGADKTNHVNPAETSDKKADKPKIGVQSTSDSSVDNASEQASLASTSQKNSSKIAADGTSAKRSNTQASADNQSDSHSATQRQNAAASHAKTPQDNPRTPPKAAEPSVASSDMANLDKPDSSEISTESGNSSESSRNQEQTMQTPQTGSAQAGQQGQVAAKKQANKSKSNKGQQQSSGERANPNSQNSGNHGDEGIKKSRGINSLMLAVPMEDQFIGTPGPGAEQQTMKQQPPSTPQPLPIQAAARGANHAVSTDEPMRVMQPWQLKLLQQFYQQQHANAKASSKP